MQLTRVQAIVVGVGLLIILSTLGWMAASRGRGSAVRVEGAASDPLASQATGGGGGSITVHVAGAVQSPGVYRFSPGARIYEAVQAAGGFSGDADYQVLNLAAPLKDGDRVWVPARGYGQPQGGGGGAGGGGVAEIPAYTPPPVQQPAAGAEQPAAPAYSGGYPTASSQPGAYYTDPASTPGGPQPAAQPTPGATGPYRPGSSGAGPAPGPAPAAGAGQRPVASRRGTRGSAGASYPVSINNGSVADLEAVPHIGPAMAGRIVAYRNQHGPFSRIEDLRNVKGIGEKTLIKIAPYITP